MLATALLLSLGAGASEKAGSHKVFKCTKDGVTVYSQVECSLDAEQIVVELQQGLPDENYQAPYIEQQQALDSYLLTEQTNRKIAAHEADIARYKKQLEQEFAALQQTRFRSNEAKDKAINTLSKKYNRLIKIEQASIKMLHKNLNEQKKRDSQQAQKPPAKS